MSDPYSPQPYGPPYGAPPTGSDYAPHGGHPAPPGYAAPAPGGYAVPHAGGYGAPGPGLPPPPPEHADQVWPPPAGWGARVGAYIVDTLIALPIFLVCFYGGLGLIIFILEGQNLPEDQEAAIGIPTTLLFGALGAFLSFSYFWFPHARSGRTLGKRLFGIKVVSMKTGEPPSLGLSAGRQLVHIGMASVTCVGWLIDVLWPLWDQPYQQAVHDKAVGTRVITVRGAGAAPPPGRPGAAY
ncbi:RDD family protein [Streptomonospora nanhaiensis]|uniref:RDD family protein n=1 Tax=Streptomonospora nanhaiensis TaxID=1323731 RepID=UPI001C99E39A|nr:RDD family protein [Streptomonospora nanhaiensis]MBX9388963.1 RDD family protein [Streptomonospora nanhaiensis]